MYRWHRRQRQLRACSFLTSVAFVVVLQLPYAVPVSEPPSLDQQQHYRRSGRELLSVDCHARAYSDLLIVSTLDGQISALNLAQGGKVAWSLGSDTEPLLSSSISHLEIEGPEGNFKVIPSLNGGLFKWKEEEMEPVPFSADTLLSSSFKLYENLVMVGGKESVTHGVNAKTGKIRYMCSSEGCNTFLGDDDDMGDEDIVVIQRNQQTVRAVEQRTGAEKWNFSVGQYEITYVEGDAHHCKDVEDEDYCWEENKTTELPIIKVFMSPGAVVALSRDGHNDILWKQEFPCAIANAWLITGGVVEELDIFASSLPMIASAQLPGSPVLPVPMLYLDKYKDQLYVQTPKVLKDVLHFSEMFPQSRAQDDNHAVALPRVRWRPYVSTPSRTPTIVAHDKDNNDEGAVALWNQYPFDSGYYPRFLYLDQTPKEWEHVIRRSANKAAIGSNKSGADELVYLDLLTISIWNWWKEILSISMVIAITMQVFWNFVKKSTKPVRGDSIGSVSNAEVDEVAGIAEEMAVKIPQVAPVFKSRYLTDFEHQECLGKGGFGIVFQAKNTVDENNYAIKRISLPNREDAREKVLREARALARLDHPGIVRYFNSWLEEPPPGWQEHNDKQLLHHGDELSDFTSNATSATPCTFNKDSHLVRNTQQFETRTSSLSLLSGGYIEPLPEAHEYREQPKKVGSIVDSIIPQNSWLENSAGFPSSWDKDESGSFSIEFQGVDDSKNVLEDSLSEQSSRTPRALASINTGDSDLSESISVPFQKYAIVDSLPEDTDSVQIVFEDSGCADKEDQSLDRSLSSCPTQTDSSCQEFSKKQSSSSCTDRLLPVLTGTDQGNKDQHTRDKSVKTSSVPRVYLYIQMQLCQKETLKDWLSNNTLSRDRTKLLHIFDQMLGAVHYVHECGMIHRDLKPSNIFFSLNGTVKIGDFGLVTAIDTELDNSSMASSDIEGLRSTTDKKHTGLVGTQLYMSPEQLSGNSYDSKVDIFSLGLIFFELLHPFSTQMERIQIMAGAARQLSFPSRFTKELPTETQFAKWLLSSSPEKRPEACKIMENELFSDMYRDYIPPGQITGRQRYASNSSN